MALRHGQGPHSAPVAAPRGHLLSPSTEEPVALSRSAGGGDAASPLAAMWFCPALGAPSQAGLGAGAGGLCPWRWGGSASGGTVSSQRETGPGRPGRRPLRRCCSPGRQGRSWAGRRGLSGPPPPGHLRQTGVQSALTVMGPGHLVATSGGDGLAALKSTQQAALRTLRPVMEGWTDCARWMRVTRAVLSPQIQGRGGKPAPPCFYHQDQVWAEQRRDPMRPGAWRLAGDGKSRPGGTQEGSVCRWDVALAQWASEGPVPKEGLYTQASVQNQGDGAPTMAPPPEEPRVRRAGWPVGEGPTLHSPEPPDLCL